MVLTVGDPARVDAILRLCDASEELAHNGDYRSARAEFKGQKFTVISHGMGGAGAVKCFEELISLGARMIIRAGTCSSLKPERLRAGDLFAPFAVAKDPDVSDVYAHPRMPAVATPRVYHQLIETGQAQGIPLFTGIGLSSGLFYKKESSFNSHLSKYAELIDAAECEFQALFLVGIARDIETAGIATVDGSSSEGEDVS